MRGKDYNAGMINATAKKDIISVPRAEYVRLKKLDARFRDFLAYFEHLAEIRGARAEIKSKKLIPQKALFEKLGI